MARKMALQVSNQEYRSEGASVENKEVRQDSRVSKMAWPSYRSHMTITKHSYIHKRVSNKNEVMSKYTITIYNTLELSGRSDITNILQIQIFEDCFIVCFLIPWLLDKYF